MIHTVECFCLTCDNCGQTYFNEHTGFSVFGVVDDLIEEATDDSWADEEGKHYCPTCYLYDEDDKIVVIPPRANTNTPKKP